MDLHDSMIKLLESDDGDVTISSDDGKSIKVARIIICNVTDYFGVVLHDGKSLKASMDYHGLKYVLRYIYTCKLEPFPSEMNVRNKFKVLDTSRLWLLPQLETHLVARIKKEFKPEMMFELYHLSDKFAVDVLQEYAVNYIKEQTDIKRGLTCYDAKSSDNYRYCCMHKFKPATSPGSGYCYHNTAYSQAILPTANKTFCCKHKNGTDFVEIDYSAEIDKLNNRQLKVLLNALTG